MVASRLYFSTGGGAVLAEGEAAGGVRVPRVPYAFDSAEALLAACRAHGKRICDLVRANECALFSPGEVRAGLLLVAQTMRLAVERGLTIDGELPSGGGADRAGVGRRAARIGDAPPREMCAVYATAVGEENACGGRVVAAPSAGACGPVAALHAGLARQRAAEAGGRGHRLPARGRRDRRACCAHAGVRQVGCQGEIGVAAAMAAAGLASVLNASNAQVLYAAERALEPHLGLPCDPTAGRIEAPCIERGALAATRAYDAAHAAVRMPAPRVGPRHARALRRQRRTGAVGARQAGLHRRLGGQRGGVLKHAAARRRASPRPVLSSRIMHRRTPRPALAVAALLGAALLVSACENPLQKKREEELAKTTFACQLNGERFVVRFADGEARILLPGAQRVTLYQIPAGVRRPLQQRHDGAARQGQRAASSSWTTCSRRCAIASRTRCCRPRPSRPAAARVTAASAAHPAVGVIGAGAMGMGVVRSLLRAGFATHVRDIRPRGPCAGAGAWGHLPPLARIARRGVPDR